MHCRCMTWIAWEMMYLCSRSPLCSKNFWFWIYLWPRRALCDWSQSITFGGYDEVSTYGQRGRSMTNMRCRYYLEGKLDIDSTSTPRLTGKQHDDTMICMEVRCHPFSVRRWHQRRLASTHSIQHFPSKYDNNGSKYYIPTRFCTSL